MGKKTEKRVAFRLPDDLYQRIEAAKRRLERVLGSGYRVTWSDVARTMIEAGLEKDEANSRRSA